MENSHINESILSEEILEDQKKNRIDHMTYLPGMEDIGSDVMDQVISAMNAYDYEKYTEAASPSNPSNLSAFSHSLIFRML